MDAVVVREEVCDRELNLCSAFGEGIQIVTHLLS